MRNFKMNVLNFLRIIIIFHLFKNGYTKGSMVFRDNKSAKDAPSGSNCFRPQYNDEVYHSCLEGPYPTNRTKCRCSSNYNQFIHLVCVNQHDDYFWVMDSKKLNCADALTDPVTIGATVSNLIGHCKRPRERPYFFHSCDKSGYPKSSTECFCSNNYPKKLNLTCTDNNWFTGKWKNQCRGDNKDAIPIVLNEHRYITLNSLEKCEEPEEYLNYFHSCENKVYPTNITSCNCTFDNTKKINLICFNGFWYNHRLKRPCDFLTLLPNEVRCYKDPTSNKVKCNCLKNCFHLNMEKSLTHQKSYETCTSNGPIIQRNDEDYPLIMHYDNQTTTVQLNCLFGINYGTETLSCQNGILNSSMPKCKSEEISNLKNDVAQYKILTSLAGVTISIFLIVSILMVYLYCQQKTKLRKYIKQIENTAQGRRDEQLNREYEEIDEFRNNVEQGTNEIAENNTQYEEVDAVRLNSRPDPLYMDIDEQPDLPEIPVLYADARPLPLEADNGYLEPRLPPPEYDYIDVVK